MSRAKWEWFGYPAHFCGARESEFRMATLVGSGKFLVSTIGDFRPLGGKRVEVKPGAFFETLVFWAGKRCFVAKCLCRLPSVDGRELDSRGYKTAGEAQTGHMALCEKWDGERGK